MELPSADVPGTAPASVSPWQVPARCGWKSIRYEIEPGRAPRMTAQQTRKRHPSAGPQPEAIKRLIAVLRACRQVPALEADQGRQGVPVKLNKAPANPS